MRLAAATLGLCAVMAQIPGDAAQREFGAPAHKVESRPAARFAALPNMSNVRMSPDGHSVLMLRPMGDGRGLFVADLRTNEGQHALRVNAANEYLNGCEWVSSHRIVCTVLRFPEMRKRKSLDRKAYSAPNKTKVRLVAVNRNGSEPLELVPKSPRAPHHWPLGVNHAYHEKVHQVLDYRFEPADTFS